MTNPRYCWVLHSAAFAALATLLSIAADVSSAIAQTTAKPAAAANETAQLRKRVEQLEEQLIDIQVVLGTLETLAKSGGQAAGAGASVNVGGQAGGSARINALETQVRALASQVQQLSSGQRQTLPAATGQLPPANDNVNRGFASRTPSVTAPATGFGSTTVQPESPTVRQPQNNIAAPRTTFNSSGPVQSAAGGDAQAEYETAYGLLLQQDYGAAQTSFSAFLKKHPSSPLAGNAQYWLGETYYVRGKYKFAAGAFLKGYRQFSRSNKAPDSLLKLAMSLDKLGQRAAACSSLSELGQKYPQAAAHVRRRATQERSRLRC